MSAMKLRPGLLVTIATRIEGGCSYSRRDLEQRSIEQTAISRWETERTIDDQTEFAEAGRIRSAARSLIAAACVSTPFGFLICPNDHEERLNANIAEAQDMVSQFNALARHSRIRIITVTGQISSTDGEALAAVREDLAVLMRDLEGAVYTGDVENIRAIATRANQVGKLLDQQSAARETLSAAVNAARAAAKLISKRVEGAAERAADALEEIALSPISSARFFFATDASRPEDDQDTSNDLPAVSLARFAGLSLASPTATSDALETL